MPRPYSEEQLVELPAIELFSALGWVTLSAADEVFGACATLGRETPGEVVLLPRLRAALAKLNPAVPPVAIEAAIDRLTRDRSAMDLAAANREVYLLLKDGVPVSIPDSKTGGQTSERVRVIDWQNPTANDFLAARQMMFTGPLYTCRPDVVCFVNGLPLVVIEFKKPSVPARQGFDDNLTSYKHAQNGVPALFWYSALLIASNGTDSRVGSLTADWERFFEWKRIASEKEPRKVSLETMLRGTCDKARLLDLLENFTLFSEHKSGLVKILGQNHQYLGVNNAIEASMKARGEGHGRGGVFWQTQGSGKSFSMVFYAQKILRKIPGNWTFVVVTDRVELDDQIAKTFAACGAVTDAKECHATSGAHLRKLLSENHRYVFTLIHKFQTAEELCNRRDVIVLTDEAHRSQYDTLAVNMRKALPNALFLAFTGTPLIAGEERTKEVFGDYVSIYDFQQSVEDGATVPLFYENRTPELKLTNPNLNEDIYEIIENAGLDDDQEEKLSKLLGKQYHLLTRDDRLDTVAKDIVRHFLGRGFQGKAMVVSIDKATALRMHDKVRKFWQEDLERTRKELADPKLIEDRKQELQQRLARLEGVDMALIVSPGQNEIEQMKKLGLDIVPHRKRLAESQPSLDEKFKDTKDPLSLVFVCAMWLTGFDAPSCSTVYLDKPMRNHTLMQTIARANRVFPGKHNGMIVDYANVFESLEKALAIYGAGTGGTMPLRDKKKLVEDLGQAVTDAAEFCAKRGVELANIEKLPAGSMERLERLAFAVDAFISPDPLRKEFLAHQRTVQTLQRAVMPDPAAIEFAPANYCLAAIADAIKARLNPGAGDVSGVLADIQKLLDGSIHGIKITDKPAPVINLSTIDFGALAKRFKQAKRKNIELESLRVAIQAMLERMIRENPTRQDFQRKFEELIEAYNSGSKNIEELFKELLEFSRTLTEEESRHLREQLSIDELTVFDILTRPGPNLAKNEREAVKKVARALLERLKDLLATNWKLTTQARAKVREAIETTLDADLPAPYTPQLYREKCARLFEHVYERHVA